MGLRRIKLVAEYTSISMRRVLIGWTTIEADPFLQREMKATFVSDSVKLGLESVCAEGTLVWALTLVMGSNSRV